MMPVVEALTPIFVLIVLGWALRARSFVPPALWPAAEKLTYYVFFPCLLIGSLADADIDAAAVLPMAAALALGVVATTALVLAARPAMTVSGPVVSSVLQGAIRPNTYVGLAAAYGLFGDNGVTLVAIGIAVVVPLVNILSVLALARLGDGADSTVRGMVVGLFTNPIIIAVIAGLTLNATGLGLPMAIGPTVEVLGRAALPVGLMAVGAGLDLRAAAQSARWVTASVALKLLVAPALTLAACLPLGVTGAQLIVAVLYNALPTASSAYILARQMGGDSTLMAGIITATTLCAGVTIPAMLILLEPGVVPMG